MGVDDFLRIVISKISELVRKGLQTTSVQTKRGIPHQARSNSKEYDNSLSHDLEHDSPGMGVDDFLAVVTLNCPSSETNCGSLSV